MAANDYYYNTNQQQPSAHQPSSPSHYFDPAQQPPQLYPSPAPSYHTDHHHHHSSPYDESATQAPPRTDQSPFDTVFDDNAYPMNSRLHGEASSSDISQQGFYQDTSYHGGSRPHMTDDIPLQNQQPGKGPGFSDHIYDAPAEVVQSNRQRNGRGKVRLGELGMLGTNKKRIPWLVYIFSAAQVAVFIAEIVRNGILTGSPIMIKPQFNPMIGPSTQVMINMGARYAPCMHNIKEIQGRNASNPIYFLCPNATQTTEICPLSELCGFGGSVPDPIFDGNVDQSPQPNQWFRFIVPIFLHAGIIHIGFNLLLQMTIGKDMEMAIGPIRFFLVYISAGIFGFVMGGNFAAPGIASTGASGSLFGIIALTLLDLLYSWKDRRNPVKDLMFILLDVIISFVLGLLPGLDNFSHIGGFLTGLTVGICVLHSPNSLRRRLGQDASYAAVDSGTVPFYKSPIGFFKGRKPLWWAWWLVRVAALIFIIVIFIVLLNRFYNVDGSKCSWCKYLSCIPVNNWCDLGQIQN